MGYGTADIGSALNDVLPFEFDRRGKTNLTLRTYPGLDHRFTLPLPAKNGRPQEPEWHGDEVFSDVMAWLETPARAARYRKQTASSRASGPGPLPNSRSVSPLMR